MLLVLLAVLLTAVLPAQVIVPTPPPQPPTAPAASIPAPAPAPALAPAPAPATLPVNWFGTGAAYSSLSRPGISGWYSYALLLSNSARIYSFTTHDITSTRTRPYTLQSSVRTGIAPVIRQFGPVTILGFGDAGMAGADNSIAAAFSGGGVVVVQLGKTDWTVVGCVRQFKSNVAGADSQQIYELGFGRTW